MGLVALPRLRRKQNLYEQFGKRLIDLAVSLLLGLLALPLFLVIALALQLSTDLPVFFRQSRVGHKGEIFTIFKFCTMYPDRRRRQLADYQGPERRQRHKSPEDPRITPIGRFLRKWSLDELPQLWNVLRGDMSLVGPRPELISIVRQYEPWQHERHVVKPGVTGLCQISGQRDGLMHEHVELDLAYIDRLSFKTDLRILLKTVTAVMGKSHGC